MPTSPMGKNNRYYQVDVSCGSSKTSGLWDYNAWRLNLDYIESNSKCNLTFTSTMSKTDYDKYIESGIALRRNTYRGKDITKYYTGTEKINNKDLYKQISDGTFDDIYVGDYFTGKSGTIWLIADIDNYWHQGRSPFISTHHATIIPAWYLENAKMNSTDTAAGGYIGSEMYTITLPNILKNTIEPDFTDTVQKSHIIEYQNLLTNSIDEAAPNQWGGVQSGASTGWEWVNRKLDLMSEVNVYGTTAWSSSAYDIGVDNQQYAIFQLNPKLKYQNLSGSFFDYWLKAVSNYGHFASAGRYGYSNTNKATAEIGVRPRFLID